MAFELPQVVRCPLREFGGFHSRKVLFVAKFAGQLSKARGYVGNKSKANLDGPKFAGPDVNVLKDVTMNGPEMCSVENTRDGFTLELRDAKLRGVCFVFPQHHGLAKITKVSKDVSSRVDVWVHI